MPVRVSLDHQRRLASYEISGPVSGQEFVDSMITALRSHPELADYDAICDVSGYTGDVATDDMASVAMLMNDLRGDADRLARTALVTLDSGFSAWAQVMSHQFERRRFSVFGSRLSAEAWLEDGQAARDAA